MEDLRLYMRMKRIPTWKVAEVIGVSEMTIYRWLRTFNADHYKKISDAIKKIEGEAKGELHET